MQFCKEHPSIPKSYTVKKKFIEITQAGLNYVSFEVFTAVTMKNAVFWDVAPCIFCVNRRFGGTYRLHLQGRKIRERGTSVSRWMQTDRQLFMATTGRILSPVREWPPKKVGWMTDYPTRLSGKGFCHSHLWHGCVDEPYPKKL
jgi:hypothetical protein